MAYHQHTRCTTNNTLATHYSVPAAPMIQSSAPRSGFYSTYSSSNLPSDIVPGVTAVLDPFDTRGQPPPYTPPVRRRPLPPIPQPVITEIPDSPQQTSPQQTSPVSSVRSTNPESPTTDYRPTLKPTYGRPLLNGTLVLVFPIGHERCTKCWRLFLAHEAQILTIVQAETQGTN